MFIDRRGKGNLRQGPAYSLKLGGILKSFRKDGLLTNALVEVFLSIALDLVQ